MNCINPRHNLIKVHTNANLSCLITVQLAYSLQITCQSPGDVVGRRVLGSADGHHLSLLSRVQLYYDQNILQVSDNHLIYSASSAQTSSSTFLIRSYCQGAHGLSTKKNAKIKGAVSVDKQRTLIRIYMEKYISV